MEQVVKDFTNVFYDSGVWNQTTWKGVPILKCPMDLWIYQEIIHRTKPDIIIETGTFMGGSANYLSDIINISTGLGEVITIDVTECPSKAAGVTYVTGSSTSSEVYEHVKELCLGKRVTVILDSDHNKKHVLNELNLYAPLVTSGCYLIVEDTCINGNPINSVNYPGGGPQDAIKEWYPLHYKDFENDKTCEKFMVTFNPGGYFVKN